MWTDVTRIPHRRDLFRMKRGMVYKHIPTSSGWTESVTGSASTDLTVAALTLTTGDTNNSTALRYVSLNGFTNGATINTINWSKRTLFSFVYRLTGTDGATKVHYVQIKTVSTHGDLAAAGIGIKIGGGTLNQIYGESYGSARGEVSLQTLTNAQYYPISVYHDPVAGRIYYFIGNVLKGTQSTAANIPSGDAACIVVASVDNALTASSAIGAFSNIEITQEV